MLMRFPVGPNEDNARQVMLTGLMRLKGGAA
jgi:hypothetical protein